MIGGRELDSVEVTFGFLRYMTDVINGTERPPKGSKFVATFFEGDESDRPYASIQTVPMTALEELIRETDDGRS